MSVNQTIIQVENLCWRAANKSILNNVSFSISKGEFVGIIGPNGAGKSSILRCIYGRNELSSGCLLVQSQSVSDYSKRQLAQKIAVVLQESPSHFELTVYDVIAMGLTPRKSLLSFNSDKDEEDIVAAATQVDLADKLHQVYFSLSGGEKQRAMIARAIVQKPEILIMDEPTNHLDIKHQVDVLNLARELGITVLVSIHDLNLAATYCDRLILMDQGELIKTGTVEEVLTEKLISDAFQIDVKIDRHPVSDKLRISYSYVEENIAVFNSSSNEREAC